MATPTVRVDVKGARGESFADVLRRTGQYGVLPTDSDSAAIAKVTSGAESAAEDAALSAAAASAFVNGILFPDTVAGLAGTASGEYFVVPGAGGTYATLYLNNAGVADEQESLLSKTGFESLVKVSDGTGAAIRTTVVGADAWATQAGQMNAIFGFEAANTLSNAGTTFDNARGVVAIGAYALADGNFSSDYTTFIGYQSGRNASAGYCATAVGLRTGFNLAGGGYNTMLGCDAGAGVTTGQNNTFVGAKSGLNIAEGDPTLTPVGGGVTGQGNTGCGVSTLYNLESGSFNTALGALGLQNLTTASSNTTVGYLAGQDITTSGNNTLVGYGAGSNLTTGLSGTGYNVAMGVNALNGVDAGGIYRNVAIGALAFNVYTGAQSVAIGYGAGGAMTSGSAVLIGYDAGGDLTTGSTNTLVGTEAGSKLTTTGANTALGYRALQNNTGSSNTAIGFQAHNDADAFNNCTSLGNGATPTASNQVTLGNASVATLRCQVTTITALSDVRCKKDINDAPAEIGLDLIRALPVRTFHWKKTAEGVPATEDLQLGMIAQEWDAALTQAGADWLGVIDKSNPDRWEAAPHKMFFSLLMAVQQLAERNDELERRIAALER